MYLKYIRLVVLAGIGQDATQIEIKFLQVSCNIFVPDDDP